MKKNNILIVALAATLGFFCVYLFSSNEGPGLERSQISKIDLKNKDGVKGLYELEGKVLIMYVGFTHCPDICPNSLGKLSKKLKTYTSEVRDAVTPVFVSVDWKRDTPETVQEYIEYFSKKGVAFSGTRSNIDKLVREVGAFYQFVPLENSALGFTVDHTSRFFVFDKKGNFVRSFLSLSDEGGFTKTINQLVSE